MVAVDVDMCLGILSLAGDVVPDSKSAVQVAVARLSTFKNQVLISWLRIALTLWTSLGASLVRPF